MGQASSSQNAQRSGRDAASRQQQDTNTTGGASDMTPRNSLRRSNSGSLSSEQTPRQRRRLDEVADALMREVGAEASAELNAAHAQRRRSLRSSLINLSPFRRNSGSPNASRGPSRTSSSSSLSLSGSGNGGSSLRTSLPQNQRRPRPRSMFSLSRRSSMSPSVTLDSFSDRSTISSDPEALESSYFGSMADEGSPLVQTPLSESGPSAASSTHDLGLRPPRSLMRHSMSSGNILPMISEGNSGQGTTTQSRPATGDRSTPPTPTTPSRRLSRFMPRSISLGSLGGSSNANSEAVAPEAVQTAEDVAQRLSRTTRNALALFRRSESSNSLSRPGTGDSQDTVNGNPNAVPSLADLERNFTGPRPGEDQAAMLSRLLSVAAAATAASLVGNNDQAWAGGHDVAGNNSTAEDGSFQGFLQALRGGRLAAALRNGGSELGSTPSAGAEAAGNAGGEDAQAGAGAAAGAAPTANGDLPPLNFFRMFRFNNANNAERAPDQPRTVPVIIVGIRSVPPRDANGNIQEQGQQVPMPFFDALANLAPTHQHHPHLHPTAQQPQGPVPFDPANADSAETASLMEPTPINPAEQTLPQPAAPEGMETTAPLHPGRRPLPQEPLPGGIEPTAPLSPRRRMSAPQLGAGVAPPIMRPLDPGALRGTRDGDRNAHVPPVDGAAPPNATRSWIIYVLGGAYPDNHPILTTPSLFTENPTYEDMMLLSSMIGPAKPPTATTEDIADAGGICVIGDDAIVADGDRCLVCLSDFAPNEVCRKLTKCGHLFHKECIDQWLTTGRNSCPLCREQGVKEKHAEAPAPAPEAGAAEAPSVPDAVAQE
ncbi:hypothetical protein G7K_1556-t1 [Saitoella complicata NRRL Y-17804]|uniref:RING-type domain-containing protein n=2 Tax=Saitoella complicata (strain BCRC 22490 / CBS 7301 / JCM 7358 / NBRC 10748 / NRRL Y-17804) TaxID=698492 RepID=A0A0E9NC01_SAICN|nr:hypothetical protein G7K_1556-t1 [Saitoella complicata NRRL Y-17804]